MESRASLADIRIVNVTKEGKEASFGSLCDRLGKLSPDGFVAVDTEFSGLGTDPHLSHDDLKIRYAAIQRMANTRAIFSVGISVFSPAQRSSDEPSGDETSGDEAKGATQLAENGTRHAAQTYEVATYDFLMSCQDDFTTNANAGAFLVAHSFDFKRMFQKGIPYTRASTELPPEAAGGNDATKDAMPWRWGKMPRGLLWRIGRQGVPLVLHNGLYDLAFLYAAFQGPLPDSLNGFIGALLDCIPAGYWDSKILAEAAKERATFLGYLFANNVLKGFVAVRNAPGLPRDEVADPPDEQQLVFAGDTLCALYSFRGFCPRGTGCPFLHDPFLVVEAEQKGQVPKDSKAAFKKHKQQSKELKRRKDMLKGELSSLSKKKKKKLLLERAHRVADGGKSQALPESMVVERPAQMETNCNTRSENESKAHTAGWDAFCTGYIFAAYRACLPNSILAKERNKIALQKKLGGLLLSKSNFGDLDSVSPSVPIVVKNKS